jgi:hypothetical protein
MASSRRLRLYLVGALVVVLSPAVPAWSEPPAPPAREEAPTTSSASEAGAMALARRQNRPVEVASLTTERRKVVADPLSGSFKEQLNANPVRVKRDGSWVDLDSDLQRVRGRLQPKAAKVDIAVADGGSGPLVSVADGDQALSLRWTADKSLPAPSVRDDKAIYTDIRPGIDLVVQTNDYGFSQYLVVRTRAAAADPLLRSFSFDVVAPNLTITKAGGGLEARGPDGEVVFVAPQLQMWSSSGDVPTTSTVDTSAYVTGSMEPGKIADVDSTLRGTRLTLNPDRSLLDDPNASFPIVIDPTISRRQANWVMVWSNGYEWWNPDDDDHSARVGYDGWSEKTKKSRVFYTFDTTALKGKTVKSATFTHKQIHSPSWDCDQKTAKPAVNLHRSGTISSSTTWPGPTVYDFLDDSDLTVGHADRCKTISTQEWSATQGAKDAAANSWNTLTLRLASDDESDKWGWRQYQNTSSYPVLSITYNTPPVTPDAVRIDGLRTYEGQNYIGTTRPTLRVKVKDVDDGDDVRAKFIINPVDAAGSLEDRMYVWSGTVNNPGLDGIEVHKTVDPDMMSHGLAYSIYARAVDKDVETVSGPATKVFVDTVAPGAPAVSGPDGAIAQGSTVTIHVDAPEGDVASYLYGLNSGTPTTTATPSTLGGAVDIKLVASQFGPNFFTVQSVDRAGNRTSTPSRFEFKVDGTQPSDRYRLDKSGTDDRTGTAAGSTGSNLTIPTSAAVTWVPGRDAKDSDGVTPRDCTDFAVQLTPATAVKSLSTPTGHPIDTSRSFTAAAWLKTDDLSTTASNLGERYALAMPVGGGAAFSLGYRKESTTNQVYWQLSFSDPLNSSTRTRVPSIAPSVTTVTAGRWTHVVGVYDVAAKTATLYVDGQRLAQQTLTTTPGRGTQLVLGSGPYNGSSLTWNGAVDEVVLYQGALGAAQVNALANTRRASAGC